MATASSGSRPSRRSRRPAVYVLRVGHRAGRDPRLTTHLALTARALGARAMWLHPPDPDLAERVAGVARGWGGRFEIRPTSHWRETLKEFDGLRVHLTMYGQPLGRVLPRLRRARRVLLVVGGAKVPPELYCLADVNAGVGHQPHSEVAAVAVTLTQLLGVPRSGAFRGARQRVVPQARGKRVLALLGPP